MQLKGDDATGSTLGFALISDVDGLLAIDELLKVVAVGDDYVIVPSALFEAGLLKRHLPAAAVIDGEFFKNAGAGGALGNEVTDGGRKRHGRGPFL